MGVRLPRHEPEPVDLGDGDTFRLVLDVAEGRIGVEDIADRLITS
jgi:hypothetical protein